MVDRNKRVPDTEAGLEHFIQDLFKRSSELRFNELFVDRPRHALYYELDRGGICTVALPTQSLECSCLKKLLTYRLAQYLAVKLLMLKRCTCPDWSMNHLRIRARTRFISSQLA